MLFSPRQVKILSMIINRDGYTKLNDLCSILKVSKRTILREIKGLSKLPYDLALNYNSQKGLKITGEIQNKTIFKQELINSNIPYTNKKERQNLLILELLRSNEVKKIYYFASLFNVSEATISNDLEAIEPWFIKQKLSLNRKAGVGIFVSGQEVDYRQALVNILKDDITDNPYYKRMNIYDSKSIYHELACCKNSQNIFNLLNKDILDRVLLVFNTYNHELELDRYAKASYFGLIIHLSVAIDRIIKHEAIETNDAINLMLQDDYSLTLAKLMAKKIENEFDINIPDGEISFIALHIKGSNTVEIDEYANNQDNQLNKLVLKMLQATDNKYRQIFINDHELITGLIAHLKPTIIRIKYHSKIINPLKEQIMQNYHDYYQQACKAATIINDAYQITLTSDEIAYIALHFGASYERNSANYNKYSNVTIGIVCASGIGLSALLLARIKKQINYNVRLITLSVAEVLDDNYDVDILISTFEIKTNRIILLVNPLLTELDILNIKELIELYGQKNIYRKRNEIKVSYREIIKIMRRIKFIYPHVTTLDNIYTIIANKSVNTNSALLIADLKKREALQSNLYYKYNFGLLHCVSKAILMPQVMFLFSDGEFNQDKLHDINFILVLLAPKNMSKAYKRILSLISQNIIESDDLYQALKIHDEDKILDILADIYDDYLQNGE